MAPTAGPVLLALALMAPSGIGYELSASGAAWRHFLTRRILGNLAGLLRLLAYVGLLRLLPLPVGHPMTVGLAIAPRRSDAWASGRRASTWRLGLLPRAHPAPTCGWARSSS